MHEMFESRNGLTLSGLKALPVVTFQMEVTSEPPALANWGAFFLENFKSKRNHEEINNVICVFKMAEFNRLLSS